MKILVSIFILISSSFLYSQQNPDMSDADPRFLPDTFLLYKSIDTTNLYLHVFLPDNFAAEKNYPCIIFFFGGGWVKGAPAQFYPQAHHFASRGMIAVCAEYRIKTKHGTSPYECVKDARSAMRWLKINAAKWKIDTNRIIASGGSAGGHLAASTAMLSNINESTDNFSIDPMPDALVLFNPAVGLDKESSIKRFGNNWKDLTPTYHITKSVPPTIVFHGEQDSTVYIRHAQEFCNKIKEVGGKQELYTYPGQGHGFFNYRISSNPYYYKTLEKADEFLTELGFIKK